MPSQTPMTGSNCDLGNAMIKTKIATVTINLIIAVAIVSLNLIIVPLAEETLVNTIYRAANYCFTCL